MLLAFPLRDDDGCRGVSPAQVKRLADYGG